MKFKVLIFKGLIDTEVLGDKYYMAHKPIIFSCISFIFIKSIFIDYYSCGIFCNEVHKYI